MTAEAAPRRAHRAASASRIEASIRAAQACGLTVTSVIHQPDGTVVIGCGDPPAEAKPERRVWQING
jgi:hypothetical protein